MNTRSAFRLLAVMLAVAALADPVVSRTLATRQPVTLAIMIETEHGSDAAPVAEGRRAAAVQLQSALAADYDVEVRELAPRDRTAACPAEGGCILISSGAVPMRLTAGARVIGAVQVGGDVRGIDRIEAPETASIHEAPVVRVHLRRQSAGATSAVQILDDAIAVGEASHQWIAGDPAVRALDVHWVPVAAGIRRLHVVATSGDGVVSHGEIAVEVEDQPAPVLLYEPQSGWMGTFVRRALNGDPRLRLDAITRVAPGVVVGSAAPRTLARADLDRVHAVVVSVPGELTESEVALLEGFARVRGGSVVLVLDERPSGPVTRLLPPILAERRHAEARAVGTLHASELVAFDASDPAVSIIAIGDAGAIVVSRATGRGRVIASGALDAWRYRGTDGNFNRFWGSLVVAASVAAGPALRVTLPQRLLHPGDEAPFIVEWQPLTATASEVAARAHVTCGDEPARFVRLWPGARAGTFEGRVSADVTGRCRLGAELLEPAGLTQTAELAIADDARLLPPPGDLEASMHAAGAVVVDADDAHALAARVAEQLPVTYAPRDAHPLRSPVWFVPFALALCAEWWLRRRRALR